MQQDEKTDVFVLQTQRTEASIEIIMEDMDDLKPKISEASLRMQRY
jgi:hypothetical protein